MRSANETPWADWLRAAAALGVTPAAFWRLSVREWRALTAAADAPLARNELEALMQRFPDE